MHTEDAELEELVRIGHALAPWDAAEPCEVAMAWEPHHAGDLASMTRVGRSPVAGGTFYQTEPPSFMYASDTLRRNAISSR